MIRRLAGWVVRLAIAAAVVIVLVSGAGWNYAGAIIFVVIVVPLFEFVLRLSYLGIRSIRDSRRGLAVREWSAIRILGNCAEKSDRTSFNQFTLSRLKRTDSATLMGYATIVTNQFIVQRLGPDPSDAQLDSLAIEVLEQWRSVMPREATVLNRLLREARDYRRNGFPDPTWENCRSMIAAAGVLRPPRSARRKPMRFEVAAEYRRCRAGAEPAPTTN